MNFLRALLLPFSLLYALAAGLRNCLYDKGMLKSVRFSLPVLVVGNLEVGGAGKTPVVEYLIRLLKDRCRLAVLSRGYGRATRGYIGPGALPEEGFSAQTIGDEPFQYYLKFPDITVAVGEDRVAAIERLREGSETILLDDAFQHRRLQPGFSIVVLDYNTLFRPRWPLPAGNYREAFAGRKRADVLLVSKAPFPLTSQEEERIAGRIRPRAGQLLCFSSLEYEPLRPLFPEGEPPRLDAGTKVLLLTGIARPAPFLRHVRSISPQVTHLKYPDHHSYSLKNIAKIAEVFERMGPGPKMILTTEKDASRLRAAELEESVRRLPVFYQPIRIRIHDPGKALFDGKILAYVTGGGRGSGKSSMR